MGNYEVFCRVKLHLVQLFFRCPVQDIESLDACNLVKIKLDSVGSVGLHVRRVDFDNISPHTEISPFQDHVIPLVLNRSQIPLEFPQIKDFALFDVNAHFLVKVRHTQTVNAADRGHDDYIPSLHKRVGCRQTELVDFVICGGVFFDVKVASWHVGFRLVVVVIRDKIFHRVVGKK